MLKIYVEKFYNECNENLSRGTNTLIRIKKEAVMNSLEQAYIELQPKLYTFFIMKTSNKTVAEDLTQDVFYEASKTIHQFKGDSTISTWLFSIARHLLAKYYRSKKYEQSLKDKLGNSIERVISTETAFEIKEELRLLQLHIANLDDVVKDILLLRLYGELSFAEIGGFIGKSDNYARVTYFRAKQKIMKEMEGF